MSRPLEGLLVVALEQAVAAPFCSARLADAGARVIKIERSGGDFARGYDAVAKGESAYFAWLNRGKESIVLDIKRPADRRLLEAMVAKADIFIQNLGPGAAERAGFGSADLRERHPALITCDISGYGAEGPYAKARAYDLLIQAESGLAGITGAPEAPGRVGVSVCDIASGLYAYGALLEALIGRGREGAGRAVSVSLFQSMADWMTVPLLHHDYGGKGPARVGLNHPSIAPYGAYRSGDGKETLIAIQNEREWARLCGQVLGDAALAADPRFAGNAARVANRAALDAVIEAVFGGLDQDQLLQRLEAAQIAYGRVNGLAELSAHPQLRRMAVETPGGSLSLPAPPAQFGADPPHFGPVPGLDQHGTALRREFADGERVEA